MDARDAYVKKIEAQLDEWSAELDRLEAKLKKGEANAEIKYQEQFSQLRESREELKMKLGQLKKASEDSWEDLKGGVENSFNKVRA